MNSEARKKHVIEEVLKVQSEAVLIEIESILKRKGTEQKKENNVTKRKPSDYASFISEKTAKEFLQQIEQSRNE